MPFPKLNQDAHWRLASPHHALHRPMAPADAVSPPLQQRRVQALAIIATLAALGTAAGLDLVHDPRPLDEQAGATLRRAGQALHDWQAQLTRGLQVSLRAVADGRDRPPPEALAARPSLVATAIDADDRDQPVEPEPEFKPRTRPH